MNAVIEHGRPAVDGRTCSAAASHAPAGPGLGPVVGGPGVREVLPGRGVRRGVDRSQAWRRPAGRPATVGVRSARMGSGSHLAAGARTRHLGRTAVRGGGVMAVVAVAVALAAVIFFAAQVRSMGSSTLPSSVGTVEVAAGETLSSIAARVAPGAPTAQVIDRISELNGLDGAHVRVGQSLLVPQRHAG